MAHSFEVGDVVTGKQSATNRYGVTICGTIMRVENVCRDIITVRIIDIDEELATGSMEIEGKPDIPMRIRMIKHDAIVGSTFDVRDEYFEIYSCPTDPDELSSFLDDM